MELCLTSAVRTTRRQRRLYGSVSAALEGLTKSVAVFAHPRPDAGRNVLPSAQRPERQKRNYDNGVAGKRFKAGMGLLLLPTQPDYGRVDRTPHGPSPDAVEGGRPTGSSEGGGTCRWSCRCGSTQECFSEAPLASWAPGPVNDKGLSGRTGGRSVGRTSGILGEVPAGWSSRMAETKKRISRRKRSSFGATRSKTNHRTRQVIGAGARRGVLDWTIDRSSGEGVRALQEGEGVEMDFYWASSCRAPGKLGGSDTGLCVRPTRC